MKEFIKLVVFILLFYSCKEKLNEPKQENLNAYNQHSTLDRSRILDSIDSISISEIPILPPTEGVAIDADLQIIGNLILPDIESMSTDERHRNAERRIKAITRYLRRGDPTYKPSTIPGVSSEQLDADYEAFLELVVKERAKIEKKTKLSAKKIFGN